MNTLIAVQLQTGVAIFLMVLIVLLAGAGIYFLYRGVKHERNRFISEKFKIGELDKDGFDEMLTRKIRTAGKNTHFSVMRVEINDAKSVIDSFGQKSYDQAIDKVIGRMYKVLPKGARVCHYDLDSIGVFVEEDLDKKSLGDLATFILTEGHKSMTIVGNVEVEFDLNIGVASYNAFAATIEILRQNVDLSLAVSKRRGLNRYAIYSEELLGSDSEEYRYYQEIKSAIEANEFTLYYQPIYDLSEDKICAYESLLRWNHKTLGVLSPDKFLRIMEQSGDINWVGVWAFERLLETAQYYRQKNPDNPVVFTVNLSPKQLMNPSLESDFRRVLKKYKVPSSTICFEIVEFAAFDTMPEVRENIEKLRQAGFMIAIDDFGLEMSTLKLLENLKVDWVKLDRSFVEQSKDDFLVGGVVDTLVGFAERSGFKVVAEGIEDDVTLEYVRERNIGYGQGYFFGKPLPPENYNIR